MLSESCPGWSSNSPTTLFVYARLHTGLGWITGIALPSHFPIRRVAGQGVLSHCA